MTTQKTITVPVNFKPRDYQLEVFRALDNGIKRVFLRWHRRGGKDLTCISYVGKAMLERPGIYYYVLPTYAQGRKIIWEGMDKAGNKFLDKIPKELVVRKNNQEMILELSNGSIFRVVGADADKIDQLVGTNPIFIVLSEFGVGESYAKVLDFFRPILKENGGTLIINGTPRGRNHMYTLENKIKHNKNWFFSALQTIAPDYPTGRYTGVHSPQKIQEERDDGMSEPMIEQEYGVSYTATSRGRIYDKEIERCRKDGRIGAFPHDPNILVDTFWDIGVSDATAIWFAQRIGHKRILIDYYEAEGKTIPHYIDILRNKGYRYRTHYLPHDGRRRDWQSPVTPAEALEVLLKDANLPSDVYACRKPGYKNETISGVRKILHSCYFNEGTTEQGVEMLSLYHYKLDPKRDVLLKEPVHDWTSHCCDAFGTMVYAEEYEDEIYEYNNAVTYRADNYDDNDFDPLEY